MENILSEIKVIAEAGESFEIEFKKDFKTGEFILNARSGDTFSISCFWKAPNLKELGEKIELYPEGEDDDETKIP